MTLKEFTHLTDTNTRPTDSKNGASLHQQQVNIKHKALNRIKYIADNLKVKLNPI